MAKPHAIIRFKNGVKISLESSDGGTPESIERFISLMTSGRLKEVDTITVGDEPRALPKDCI